MASGVKRSLFTKPAWAAAAPAASTSPSTAAGDDSVFGRNTVYEDILVAEQKKREKKQQEKARDRSAPKDKDDGRDAKRRRVSDEAEDDVNVVKAADADILSDSDNLDGSASSRASEKRPSPIVEDRPATRSTPKKDKVLNKGLDDVVRSSRTPRRNPAAKRKALVDLDSDGQAEDDELVMLTPPSRSKAKRITPFNPKPPLDDYESEEEDEFLQELKQKAREKARLQKLGLLDGDQPSASATTTTDAKSASRAPAPGRPSSAEQNRPGSSSSTAAPPHRETSASQKEREREKADDPEVKILITSPIPDTEALIVKRKASQPLKQVREFWCQRNNLDAKTTAQVFFTWRGTRLFDSTTMRGPIQKLKSDEAEKRRMRFDDYDDDDNDGNDGNSDAARNVEDPSQGRIMLEAMTQEIFDARQLAKERKAQGSGDHVGHENDGDSDDAYYREQEAARERAEREAEEKMKDTIVVRLVSQTSEPMNLRVRPHTSVRKMMQGFAATKGLEEGKTAWLIFDGDRLDPKMTVEDLGLEDDDEIEVHIR